MTNSFARMLAASVVGVVAVAASAAAAHAATAGLTLAALQNTTYPSQFTLSKQAPLRDGAYDQRAALGGDEGAHNPAIVRFVDASIMEQGAAVLLSTNTGGSGVFVTLHLVTQTAGAPLAGPGLLLGDRWRINSLAFDGDRLVLDVTRSGPTDPLCCPTLHDVRTYVVEGNAFVLASSSVETVPVTAPIPPRTGSAGLVDAGYAPVMLAVLALAAVGFVAGARVATRAI